MKCFAVIDTNVLVSALLSTHDNAATVIVVNKMLSGEIIPLFNSDILEEYKDVLGRSKFSFSEEIVECLIFAIDKYGIFVKGEKTDVILPDMDDLPFYEVVMEKRKNHAYLITGNKKHFPKETFIVTPKEMLEILAKTSLR